MPSRQDFQYEALLRSNDLGLKPDLADVVLCNANVFGNNTDFKPNSFGLIAYLFQEDYPWVDYKDGYGNHAFPYSQGPGFFSPKGFKHMMEKRFCVIDEKDVDTCDVITFNKFARSHNGKVAETGEEGVEEESEEQKFMRAEPFSAMFYLDAQQKASFVMDLFGIYTVNTVTDTRRFQIINIDKGKINPDYELFFHTLK